MNTLAFTNNLLCEVFSMTSLMREAQEQNAQKFVPSILAAGRRWGPCSKGWALRISTGSSAIAAKVPMEKQAVNAFSQWGNAASEQILPLMEEILSEEMIPQYQRAVVQAFPDIAQTATGEAAWRDREPRPWPRPDVRRPLADQHRCRSEATEKPATRPSRSSIREGRTGARQYLPYRVPAMAQNSAPTYLNEWNDNTLASFDNYAKMSQFGALRAASHAGS